MLLAIGWLFGATGASQAAPPGSPSAPRQPVIVDAADSSVDYQSDTASFKDIVVSQGDTRVTAERAKATGLDFKGSRWTFEGNVLMTMQPGGDTLRSDQAIVQIRDNRVAQTTATGSPAQFEQQGANSRPAIHGHADRIDFDATNETLRLTGDASLSNGDNEITGPLLIYSLRDQKLTARSPGRSRSVHVTIVQPTPNGDSAIRDSTTKPEGARSRAPKSDRSR